MPISEERREMALQIWRNRERRVLCSLANAFMLAKVRFEIETCLKVEARITMSNVYEFKSIRTSLTHLNACQRFEKKIQQESPN